MPCCSEGLQCPDDTSCAQPTTAKAKQTTVKEDIDCGVSVPRFEGTFLRVALVVQCMAEAIDTCMQEVPQLVRSHFPCSKCCITSNTAPFTKSVHATVANGPAVHHRTICPSDPNVFFYQAHLGRCRSGVFTFVFPAFLALYDKHAPVQGQDWTPSEARKQQLLERASLVSSSWRYIWSVMLHDSPFSSRDISVDVCGPGLSTLEWVRLPPRVLLYYTPKQSPPTIRLARIRADDCPLECMRHGA